MKLRVSRRIYHYTNADTLEKIVSGQRIRASCLAYLNDTSEIVHGKRALSNLCDEILGGKLPSFDSKGDTEINRHIAYKIQSMALKFDPMDVYGVCFSAAGDQLGQWRGYGDNGHGYSIGFSAKALQDRLQPESKNVLKVTYDSEEYETNFGNLLSDIRSALGTEARGSKSIDERKWVILFDLMSLVVGCKDEAFKEEKEHRIVFSMRSNQQFETAISFFARNGTLIPFIDLAMANGYKLPISKIFIGPAIRDKEKAKRSVELLLTRNGYSTESIFIKESSVPFLP